LRGRPPYSRDLVSILRAELGLDGSGRLLDVGCGPGVLAVELAGEFEDVIGIDPDAAMLDEAGRHAAARGVSNVRWANVRAEEIGTLDLDHVRTATFGQSFHWTERESVAEMVYELLAPGGSMVIVSHDINVRQPPSPPAAPLIPHAEIHALIAKYLGPVRRYGSGLIDLPDDSIEDAVARTRFGRPRRVDAPGRRDLIRNADEVVSNFLSMSFAAPPLFGDRLESFVADLHAILAATSPGGLFWDWPGDTAILIASKE
jgi:SAM-dependent methyltransferase